MKLFVRNSAIFIIPLLIIFLTIEIMLPPTLFTFRTWEAISAEKDYFIGPFYPNIYYNMVEEGDLAHHTNYAIEKKVKWRTDKLGFRNNHYNSTPDIVLIGDSNIAGSALSQEEILASKINLYTGLSVYNLAPADINTFIRLKNEGILQSPKILVLSSIERNIFLLPTYNVRSKISYAHIRLSPFYQFFTVKLDKLFRANSIEYLRSRIKSSVGFGIQSKKNDKMFFLQSRRAVIETTDNLLDQVIKRLRSYKKYCDLIGCEFVFLPIPNKETIFWELAELEEQPTFIELLNHKLRNNGITTIETIELFNYLLNHEILPYHYDDTHWNKYAVDIVAREIARLLTFYKDDVNQITTSAFEKTGH